MNNLFLECDCHGDSHTVKFYLDEEYNQLYITTHLSSSGRNFWQRLKTAIKYLFRFPTSNYGDYDDFILQQTDVPKVRELLDKVSNPTKKGTWFLTLETGIDLEDLQKHLEEKNVKVERIHHMKKNIK